MDDVPLGVTKPGIDSFDSIGGIAAVLGAFTVLLHGANNLGFVFEHLLDEGCVADGDRVSEDQDLGKLIFLSMEKRTAEDSQ